MDTVKVYLELFHIYEDSIATWSHLVINGEYTRILLLEPPKSKRVPNGVYIAKRDWHHPLDLKRRYRVWEYQNVPDRTQIQIHIGDSPEDTTGCQIVGYSIDLYNHKIYYSSKAYKELMKLTKGATELNIAVYRE